ncbi:MAG: GMC family oxidoreductase N-terminal domain-containing protein [Pseudomonadota bacterium]
MNEFDYIVVGAGSAGCVIANRLSANGKHSVLLLEAGGSDKRFFVQMPIGYGKTYYDSAVNWKYTTEPVPGLANQSSYWPRGRVLGGSSSINAMVYVRGHPLDYDDWAQDAPGWSWADVEPLFKKMEDWSDGENRYRGQGGPLSVYNTMNEVHELCAHYLKAAGELQIPFNPDYNAASMEGAALYQITTRNGLRASSARCYLHPALQRTNLTLRTQAQAMRVDFDGNRAVGVTYRHKGNTESARAFKEVILCGGAINSPQLLQLSGIGAQSLLKQFDIPVTQDLPAVGENLQDHLGADMVCRSRKSTLNQVLRPWTGRLKVGLRFLLQRKGPLTLSLNQGGGFIRLLDSSDRPDTQLYFSPLSYTRAPVGTRPLIAPDPFPGLFLGFNPCKPTSTGYMKIRSADPFESPELQPNYLSTEYDRELMLRGIRLMRQLASTPTMSEIIADEIYPGKDIQSDDELHDFIAQKSWTVFHQCGTCRMGSNPKSTVVNHQLKVHGIDALRVADASIFPTIPTGNTNAPAIMVGEKASELILANT